MLGCLIGLGDMCVRLVIGWLLVWLVWFRVVIVICLLLVRWDVG